MFKQSIFLMTAPVIVGLYTGIANAHEIEVKAGNTQVSVQSGKVEIQQASRAKPPSLLDRLSNLRLFGSDRSSSASNSKCDRNSSGYSSTQSNSSGTARSQTSSSSTTMTCN